MGINPNWPWLAHMPIKGFSNEAFFLVGAITLLVMVGRHPLVRPTMTDFLVMKVPYSYNVILGWPILNQLKATTSTNHLNIKFSTKVVVGEVKEKQVLARECYMYELWSSEKDVHTMTHEEVPIPYPRPPIMASLTHFSTN